MGVAIFKSMNKSDLQRIKRLSSQIYAALVVKHADDCAIGDDSIRNWRAMAKTAIHAADTLIKEWQYQFPERPAIKSPLVDVSDPMKEIAILKDENVELKIELDYLTSVNRNLRQQIRNNAQ